MAENRLINESSPYLLQHAHNPVQWCPWGAEALERARSEDKPIFLSVGYSSCHWCHVMAHESFENEEVARIMNESFVNVKVDREERPDIDDIYQKVCQMATGQGGWPLSVFLTPDQRPFYVGTYFPVLDSYGRPGFGSILRQLAQAWKENRSSIVDAAATFTDRLQRVSEPEISKLDRSLLDEAAIGLYRAGDAVYGGFGGAPKFPNAAALSFLFRYSKLSGISKFRELGLRTLKKMAGGGIFDQIGGGFHRYSTDARWLVPHFEKMLYDNALVPVNYAEAYQITGDPFYLDIMRRTLDFVLREMASPEGGFYSAMDADSDDGEGYFYTWTKPEIRAVLGADADLLCMYYDVTDGGNWEGRTILCRNASLPAVSLHAGVAEPEARDILRASERRLLAARSERARPGMDGKILVSWNALMITALAKGYRMERDRRYLDAALRCAEMILGFMYSEGRLLHSYKDGAGRIPGYLEDYAFLAESLLDLFEITAEESYLAYAREMAEHLLNHFWDARRGCFFMTADDHEELVIRPSSIHDLSIPSGNSVAAGLMLRLYHLTQDRRFLDASDAVIGSGAGPAAENPFGFGHLLNVMYARLQGVVEVTVLGQDSGLARLAEKRFLPEGLVVTVPGRERLDALSGYDFFAGKAFPQEGARAYVCRNFACSAPLETEEAVGKML